MATVARHRSSSEPAIPLCCSSYGRTRMRMSTLRYEKGKDKIAYWVGTCGYEEMCGLLQSLVARCSLNQLGYLWTALESVPHRDFLNSIEGTPQRHHPHGAFRPLSTALSRKITSKLAKSRLPQNKMLYRVPSTVINSKVVSPGLFDSPSDSQLLVLRSTSPEANSPSKLPGLRPSTHVSVRISPHTPHTASPSRPPRSSPITVTGRALSSNSLHSRGLSLRSRAIRTPLGRSLSTPPTRVVSPMKRHMLQESAGDVSSIELVALLEKNSTSSVGDNGPCIVPKRAFLSNSPPRTRMSCQEPTLPQEALQLLSWFSQLRQDWQQQELLQMIVTNLDGREMYFLATLLMSCQYRDFVSHLPETLMIKVMSFVPAKDILKRCCLVSSSWNTRCSTEALWSIKAHQRRMGLPLRNFLTWKGLYLDDLRLKRNWVRGRHTTRTLKGHTNKVLCARLKDGLLATGSADKTIRVWKLKTGECLCTLYGHLRSVWSVCFYGKSLVISGSSDNLIKIWNYRTAVCERTLIGHSGTIWAVQQKRDVLVSGAHDKSALLWDIRRCQLHAKLEGHHGGVFGVDLDSSAQTAFTCAGDKTIRQWEVASGVCLRVTQASTVELLLGLHWAQGLLVTCCGNLITMWDADNLKKISQFKGHEERVESVQLIIHDRTLYQGLVLSASRDKTVKYWDIKSGRCVRTLRGHERKLTCAISDEIHIVSTDEQDTIRVWDFHPHRVMAASNHDTQLGL